jgi:hypothetical protein
MDEMPETEKIGDQKSKSRKGAAEPSEPGATNQSDNPGAQSANVPGDDVVETPTTPDQQNTHPSDNDAQHETTDKEGEKVQEGKESNIAPSPTENRPAASPNKSSASRMRFRRNAHRRG